MFISESSLHLINQFCRIELHSTQILRWYSSYPRFVCPLVTTIKPFKSRSRCLVTNARKYVHIWYDMILHVCYMWGNPRLYRVGLYLMKPNSKRENNGECWLIIYLQPTCNFFNEKITNSTSTISQQNILGKIIFVVH